MTSASILFLFTVLGLCSAIKLPIQDASQSISGVFKTRVNSILLQISDWFGAVAQDAGVAASPSEGITTGWIVLFAVVSSIVLAIIVWLGYKYSQWSARNSRSKEGYRALAQAKATSSNQASEVESPTSPPAAGFFSLRGAST